MQQNCNRIHILTATAYSECAQFRAFALNDCARCIKIKVGSFVHFMPAQHILVTVQVESRIVCSS